MIKKGESWGSDASRPPDVDIEGGDSILARSVVSDGAKPLIRYRPSPGADLARAVGLSGSSSGTTELTVDALDVLDDDGAVTSAVNVVVVGVAPDRMSRWARRIPFEVLVDGRSVWTGNATGVVVANGQFLRGLDIVPRGHPGDGRIEVQVYAPTPGERAEMRRRLATGTHVPHPRILERSGRLVEVVVAAAAPVEVDGIARPPTRRLRIAVVPGALRILV